MGEVKVVLGPSGSGKSALLNILGGLDVPTAGEVRYLDHSLTSAGDAALTKFRREHVGFVFQFYNLIPSLTALENVALVPEIATHPMDSAEALRMVALGDRLHHFLPNVRAVIRRCNAHQPCGLIRAARLPTGSREPEVLLNRFSLFDNYLRNPDSSVPLRARPN
jgi:predicted ABC-type transport system involved in lysophospholipase L1 biosynthesis ATPase subunit